MLKNLTIGARLITMFVAVLLLTTVVAGVGLESLYDNLMLDRKEKTRSIVESATSIAASYYKRAQSGEITDTDARAQALKSIGDLRYGADQKSYVWVNDAGGVFLAHPTKAGVSAIDAKDANGYEYMKAFVDASQRGGDFVTYYWVRDEGKPAVQKISYVAPFAQWGWTIGTGIYVDDVRTVFWNKALFVGGLSFVILGFLAVGGYVVGRGIVAPVRTMATIIENVAAGDLNGSVPATENKDEIGAMARALERLKEKLAHARELEVSQRAEQEKKEKDAQAQTDLIEQFNSKIAEVISGIITSAGQLEGSAGKMTRVIEQSGTQTSAVASASTQTAANIQTVAAASEELSASSREIASRVSQAKEMAQNAARDAASTDQIVRELSDTAARIGDVVNLISEIAAQTNLLALNATIEAARAGEAGRGFAVVASEVKSLANQTGKATDDIASQIAAVQQQTAQAAQAISGIVSTIRQIDEASASVAAAVEEQGAATQEITRNIQQAHQGADEVASNVVGLHKNAEENIAAVRQVSEATQDVNRQMEAMRAIADDFLVRLQSGGGSLEWGPAWVTGHSVIDADHKMLVQYVNELNKAMLDGAGRDVTSNVLGKLVQYTIDHFGREEEIWTRGGLPTLTAHQRTHADLVGTVKQFQKDFAEGRANLTADLMSFLRGWLIGHVFKTDKAAVKQIMTKAG